MSITALGGTIVVEFRQNSVHGTPMLGAYLLRFFLNYSMPPWDKAYRFSNMRAKISVGNGAQLLGFAHPEMPVVLTSRGHHQDATISFEMALNAQQMEALEKLRLGGELTFTLDIHGEIFDGQGYDSRNERIQVLVNQKAWIDVLKELNFSSSILVELPLSSPIDPASAAWKALGKAKEHLYYGNYDDVVASCRMALEAIQVDGQKVADTRKAFIENRKGMPKTQRLDYVLDALEHYTHPAHHVGGIEAYSRNDAIFVLGATIAAVSTTDYKN